jgi:membrane-associated phospholipid phosphatase
VRPLTDRTAAQTGDETGGETGETDETDETGELRRARARAAADLLGIHRFSVFVPAIMSVGLVFWAVRQLLDVRHRRRARARDKQAVVASRAVSARLGVGDDGERPFRAALHDRTVYFLLAAVLVSFGLYVAIGATANYGRPGSYVGDIGWLLAVSLGASALALAYGLLALTVFVTYPDPPPWARRALLRSSMTRHPDDVAGDRLPPWQWTAALTTVTCLALLLVMVVTWAPRLVGPFDDAVAGRLVGRPAADLLSVFVSVARWSVALPVLAAAAVVAQRCRAVVTTVLVSAAGSLAVSLALRRFVDRPRPPGGGSSGGLDAFPSDRIVLAVVLAGLLPLAVAVIAGSSHVVRPLRLLLDAAVLTGAVALVAEQRNWPTDVIGGALLGAVAVLWSDRVVATGHRHARCRNCPWSTRPEPSHPSLVRLHADGRRILRAAAHGTAALAAIGLLLAGLWKDVPTNPEGTPFGRTVERPSQIVLAGLVSLGSMISWRWPAVGATMLAFAASGLGIFASVEYAPSWAVGLTGVLLVPAVLTWFAWQHQRRHVEVYALGAVVVGLLGATWMGSTAVYDHYFGPTHPSSSAVPIAVDRVEWTWVGGLDAHGVTLVAKLAPGRSRAVLLAADGDGEYRSDPAVAGRDRIVRLRVDGLRAGADVSLRVEVDGVPDAGRGHATVRTPADGPFSFRFAVASCARTGSNGAVFDEIARQDPLLFLEIGDLHYRNLDSTSPDAFLSAYDDVLARPGIAALTRQVPWAYVYDDHDYGPNDAAADSPTRAAARAAYRRAVPHYPVTPGDAPVNQAFTIGRVRFVMTDGRSERTADSMLGETQTQWLINEVVRASRTHAVVVWASTSPWIGEASATSDTWAGYAEDRHRIAAAFAEAGVKNLVMVAGDAHMVAIDDGTHTDYSGTGVGGFPLLQAAPLDRPGSTKGGPYTSEVFTGGGQFGLVDIQDDGGPSVGVRLEGRSWDGRLLVSLERQFTVPTR